MNPDKGVPPNPLAILGKKGGKARDKSLTKERKREIALMGVEARRLKTLPQATHGDPDHPLTIGDIEIPAFVLADGRRVLTQRGIQSGMGLSTSGGSETGEQRLAVFFDRLAAKGIDVKDLTARIRNPIRFMPPWGGSVAYGFEAVILADICDVILAARKVPGALHQQQLKIADRCEILMRGFARVGIVALVDEATGYQFDRPRRDLEEQLKKFLSESLRRWVRTFPADYFKHLCRLRGVELRPDMRLPQYFGVLTNNLVYRRIAPGLLTRLKERRAERGSPSQKLNQWLSLDVGIPELLLHLGTVIAVMKQHTDYDAFEKALEKVAPIYPAIPGLFDDPKDWEPR
jgi:hypothetical protein